MQKERTKLSERLLNFGAAVIKIARSVRKSPVDSYLARQVVRSATSAGASYQDACGGGQSRADFIHKLQISLKKLNETLYWLQVFERSSIGSSSQELALTIEENKELCSIIAQSIITAKEEALTSKLSNN